MQSQGGARWRIDKRSMKYRLSTLQGQQPIPITNKEMDKRFNEDR